jgi:proprotein convertase subtilisin/kexin type 5
MYSGVCHEMCDLCTGPTAADCVSCVENATDVGGTCICKPDWTGSTCQTYLGICDPICPSSCTGPSISDCTVCVENSYREPSTGYCTCLPEYSGPDCSGYTGACPPRCRHCTSLYDCCECIDNAMFTDYNFGFDNAYAHPYTDPHHQ